jgi:hypothetical protein
MVIKPTKFIKGQGMEKLMVETNLQEMGINALEYEEIGDQETERWDHILRISINNPHGTRIYHICWTLAFVLPKEWTKSQRRYLRLREAKYCIVGAQLHWRNQDGLLLRCMWKRKKIC